MQKIESLIESVKGCGATYKSMNAKLPFFSLNKLPLLCIKVLSHDAFNIPITEQKLEDNVCLTYVDQHGIDRC